jgi:hypothetical protein
MKTYFFAIAIAGMLISPSLPAFAWESDTERISATEYESFITDKMRDETLAEKLNENENKCGNQEQATWQVNGSDPCLKNEQPAQPQSTEQDQE